ncbi:DUF3617 domain-containing protein [Novosphingobium sp. B 225]|uniref:DUF3617 domain-containing protein n=1 Tax=Novosphingobium sp. B 225 TaxID=1961849 RepID=UPI000B4B575D|nr:DUF3617 domain-containing protein [Novosphingobium sp. B 225]
MPRLAPFSLAVPLLLLAACNQQPSGADAGAGGGKSVGEVQQEAAAAGIALRPQPGQYRTTIKIGDVSFPGMDQAMAGRMKGMFGAAGHSTEFCLTPDKANMGYEEMTRHAAEGNCKYDSFKADGGAIDAQMTCQTAKGMTTKSVLHGTFTPTGSDLKMTTDTSGASLPGGGMHMQAQVISERIGDCK